jgi:hypothetical protein
MEVFRQSMRLKRGTLQKLEEETGIYFRALSDYASTRKRPGAKRAKELEMNTGIPATTWLYGKTIEIKTAINQWSKNHVR